MTQFASGQIVAQRQIAQKDPAGLPRVTGGALEIPAPVACATVEVEERVVRVGTGHVSLGQAEIGEMVLRQTVLVRHGLQLSTPHQPVVDLGVSTIVGDDGGKGGGRSGGGRGGVDGRSRGGADGGIAGSFVIIMHAEGERQGGDDSEDQRAQNEDAKGIQPTRCRVVVDGLEEVIEKRHSETLLWLMNGCNPLPTIDRHRVTPLQLVHN
ncbi:MAG TPA: hypothetical protein VK694_02915 [Verrucomicrobiae bacterium]|nr:hypothetical protein [Verrucomicrobiae bacterium]